MPGRNALPANPLSISLNFSHTRLWWQTDDEDHVPEQWHVSADVWEFASCRDDLTHVADLALVIADLRQEVNLLDAIDVDDWALDFIAETVLDPKQGMLHPELDDLIAPGVPRMLILRDVRLTEAWRGFGLGAGLIAGALRTFAPGARLAVCRVSALDFAHESPDRISAELASVRAGQLLERLGFRCWHGVHVVDLRNPSLGQVRSEIIDKLTDDSES
ncbi:hypothetical protein [Haloechinothrix salitolerans]|uniref:N-acetyltransferase domain-containing protein n=1 Tax=Haloechinothrix salitolerans TaxID=926830 RepID=A0ABW2C846_9PSEU